MFLWHSDPSCLWYFCGFCIIRLVSNRSQELASASPKPVSPPRVRCAAATAATCTSHAGHPLFPLSHFPSCSAPKNIFLVYVKDSRGIPWDAFLGIHQRIHSFFVSVPTVSGTPLSQSLYC